MRRAVVTGYGAYLPPRILTNKELETRIETSDSWIQERTGITQRHIADEGVLTSHLAAEAAKAALIKAGRTADEIDLIIVGTTTPDLTMPSTATRVQEHLGMTRGAAFDVQAACSGFVYIMAVANSMILSGAANRVLVIGAETYSRILDWEDRSTCILFGDGAGALLLEAQEGAGSTDDRGILAASIYSDGGLMGILNTTGGVSTTKHAGVLTMAGKEVFRHAVEKMAGSALDALKSLGLPLESIDWVVPHQANQRILSATAKKLEVSDKKLIVTVDKHANTSAASIPLALAISAQEGRFSAGQLIVMPALGAGLTWGTCILRW